MLKYQEIQLESDSETLQEVLKEIIEETADEPDRIIIRKYEHKPGFQVVVNYD